MSMFKRIVALTMAMITCASFCLSVNALARSARLNPGVTSAYARMEINEWPQDTNSTDLHAVTLAFGEDYLSDDLVSFTAYVDLEVTLEDYTCWNEYDEVTAYDDEDIGAYVDGRTLLGGEPYYAFIDINSYHYVEVEERIYYDEEIDTWYLDSRYDGQPKSLGMYD